MDITIYLVILGALILLYAWFIYNSLITAKFRVSEALSHIDVQLKRRADLIPNLVETVKGYAKHEKDLFRKDHCRTGKFDVSQNNKTESRGQ